MTAHMPNDGGNGILILLRDLSLQIALEHIEQVSFIHLRDGYDGRGNAGQLLPGDQDQLPVQGQDILQFVGILWSEVVQHQQRFLLL